MPLTTEILEELKGLEEKATPVEWKCDDYIGEDYYEDPDTPFIEMNCFSRSGKSYKNTLTFSHHDPEGGNNQPRNDMNLIVQLRNNAKDLIEAAEKGIEERDGE
jgi:hypothetical protein